MLLQRSTIEKPKIAVGDRVTLSALGRERSPRARVRWQVGTVLRVLAYQCDVHFDGNRWFTTLHVTYLEPVHENERR